VSQIHVILWLSKEKMSYSKEKLKKQR